MSLATLLPLGTAVQIGADEGFELAKATLMLHGHGLYTEAWNDQPPLHTFLVVLVLKHGAPTVLSPRLVTVIAAAVLLAGMFWFVYRVCGLAVAGLTVALLVVSPGFLELSASCMLEIPALAPAVLALGVLVGEGGSKKAEGRSKGVRELLAGMLFGVALLMKLVPAVLLPLAALIVWSRNWEGGRLLPGAVEPGNGQRKCAAQQESQRRLTSAATKLGVWRKMGLKYAIARGMSAPTDPAERDGYEGGLRKALPALVVFSVSVAVSFVVIDLLIEGGTYLRHFQQSWTSHFGTTRSFEYGSPAEHPFDWSILLKNWDLTIPGVLGVGICWKRRRHALWHLLPVVWLALMLVVFAAHRPWWSYYYIHIALPLCWCAAIGIVAAWDWARQTRSVRWKVVFAVFGACAIAWMGARVWLQAQDIRSSPQLYSSLVLREIERLKPFTRFLYADEPVYSFHAGIPMPQNLAVLPLKRFWSGDMTNARLAAELEAARPELMLLKNDTRERPFQRLLQSEYRLVYQDAHHRLFARRAVAKAAGY
ncbi:MAG: glycosyltransferase family 39 protein [Verrucomicrobia bacterium]|nr:glycosyltransferase family 39 protein [Verrucomicrobiota bacterium]